MKSPYLYLKLFLSLFFLCSCQRADTKQAEALAQRDFLLKKYVELNKNLLGQETSFQILEALVSGDSNSVELVSEVVENNLNTKAFSDSLYAAFGEPNLKDENSLGPLTTVYRFELFSAFASEKVLIKIEKNDIDTLLTCKVFEFEDNCNPIYRNRHLLECVKTGRQFNRKIYAEEWGQINDIIRESEFWDLKPHSDLSVIDGANWTFEVRLGSEDRYLFQRPNVPYHIVNRWSPPMDMGIYRIGRKIMELSGEDFEMAL